MMLAAQQARTTTVAVCCICWPKTQVKQTSMVATHGSHTLCSFLLASQHKRYAYLAEITFAVRSNATPSTLFLSILSHIAVLAVPGCAAKASMRLLCSQICAVLSLHSTVTTHCISVRDDCVQQTDSRCWKLQHCCLMTQTTSQIVNEP